MRILEDESDADIEAANSRDDEENIVKVDEESSSTSASTAAGCFWKWQVRNLEILSTVLLSTYACYMYNIFVYSSILLVLFFSSSLSSIFNRRSVL
jgi:hypothetical protein